MPRIVYVVSNLQRAGPTFQLLNIVSHLDRSRFTPVVLTISPEPRESLKPSCAPCRKRGGRSAP
jgi:predicted O-linked N-acetylglucosamine transferase (SPINDLY family)